MTTDQPPAPDDAEGEAGMSTPDPTMNRVTLRKAAELLGIGFRVNGVAIRDYQTGRQGFVTDGGLVGWWRPENDAQLILAQRDELLDFARIVLRGLEDGHINAIRKKWNGKSPDVLSLKEAARAAIAKAEGGIGWGGEE